MIKFNIANKIYEFCFNVLAVDDDFSYLELLAKTLKGFGYDVIKSYNPEVALSSILMRSKRRIDIVICGISTSDNISAFNLLRTAKVEFNIPVILMVQNLSNEDALYGIFGGATQCVAKLPVVDSQVLKNLWQYVVSLRSHEYFSSVYLHSNQPSSNVTSMMVVGETVSPTPYRGGPISSNPTTFMETRSFVPAIVYEGELSRCSKSSVPTTTYEGGSICSNFNVLKIRDEKDHKKSEGFDGDRHQHISKKRRFNWTDEYQQIFLDAIKDITLKEEKMVPANIKTYMKAKGVSRITRENIASHLQKFRANNEKGKKGIDKSSNFANSGVTKKINLEKSCPYECQTLTKTQNLSSQDLPKQEQETPPITQPSNENLVLDHSMQDIDWDWDIFCVNNVDCLKDHKCPTCPKEICYQPQQVGQESNNSTSLNRPSIMSLDQIVDSSNDNIVCMHDNLLLASFNQDHLKNGSLNEFVYNDSQNFDSIESFESLSKDNVVFRG